MPTLSSLLSVVHLVGLVLSVGAATVKVTLLLRCRGDVTFVPVYQRVVRIVTRQIILGLVLLTLSGIGWLLLGYGFTTTLVVKLVLVGVIWVLGPVIDNVVEPKFTRLAPGAGEAPSPAFLQAGNQYLRFEFVATALFYIIILVWTWMR
jgi:hypothetical protein